MTSSLCRSLRLGFLSSTLRLIFRSSGVRPAPGASALRLRMGAPDPPGVPGAGELATGVEALAEAGEAGLGADAGVAEGVPPDCAARLAVMNGMR